jgi:uncharacterized membrane protein YhaH (DUF805 family)
MGNAVSVCLKKYATFEGRASRSEYWFFALFYIIVSVLSGFVEGITGIMGLSYLPFFALFIPSIAVGCRRMHDVGRSGWFQLIPIYNLILALTPSNPGTNKYGDL